MIEKYCASHIKTRIDAAAVNVMWPRKTNKQTSGKNKNQKGEAQPQRPSREHHDPDSDV